MRILEVVPYRVWVHIPSGRIASIFGAVPYRNEVEKAEWEVQQRGWTWAMSNGTYGFGRPAAATKEEAEKIMEQFNARVPVVEKFHIFGKFGKQKKFRAMNLKEGVQVKNRIYASILSKEEADKFMEVEAPRNAPEWTFEVRSI